ncbi:amidohydrolase family protein [Coralliovum pocilloporae]|uniref:amidohydrolase family protein n=1 Tax=Coralliovum pocilloporae TaxID=3066369 RepID=UPI003306E0AF
MRIDAHQHFWTIARGDYGWLKPELKPLYRDFGPDDLHPLLQAAGLDGTILVQAAPTRAETDFMLGLARETPFIKGVVGWADFESQTASDDIRQMAGSPALVGLRPMIQDIPDPDWMLRPDLAPAFDALIEAGLVLDALTLPHHLSNLKTLLARYPDMKVVIDHGSKPLIRDGIFEGWAEDMAAIAAETGAFCKLSGLITEAAENWTADDLRPYVRHLLTCFGPERLIWGSDWPVCTLAGTYHAWLAATADLLSDLSDGQQAKILGLNAVEVYGLAL